MGLRSPQARATQKESVEAPEAEDQVGGPIVLVGVEGLGFRV